MSDRHTEWDTAEGVVVGRRPVLDAKMSVLGYKLAIQTSEPARTGDPALDEKDAVTEVIAERAGIDGGLGTVFGTKLGFVKPSRCYLVGALELPLATDRTVLEVDADAARDAEIVEGCRQLAAAGVRLAVQNPVDEVQAAPLLDLASYVRIDIGTAEVDELSEQVERFARPGLAVLAVGVDSLRQMSVAKAAGFDLFEGRILSRPLHVVTEALTPSRITCLRMLEKVNDPDTSAADLERVVETDPGLAYRLLHVSGMGSGGGLSRPVRSIREAAVLLGRDWIYRWLILMLVADSNHGTPEQMAIAMTRARMAELMAETVDRSQKDAAFTVGLVSALDLLLGGTLAEVVSKLAITDELKAALLERAGRLGDILGDVLDWELGTPPAPLRSGVEPFTAERHYLDALSWAADLEEAVRAAA